MRYRSRGAKIPLGDPIAGRSGLAVRHAFGDLTLLRECVALLERRAGGAGTFDELESCGW